MAVPIAWEDPQRGFLDRLWMTVLSATRDPVGTFGRLGDAQPLPDVAAAARFALVVSAIGWAPFVLLAPCLAILPFAFASAMPPEVRDVGLGVAAAVVVMMPFVVVLGSVAVELVHAALFHGLALLLGGVADFRSSLHAMLYTSAIRFWLLPAIFLGFVPFVGAMVHGLVRVGFVIWSGFACYGAAKGIHGLADDRAIGVAILTPLLSMMIVMVVMGAAVFGVLAGLAGTFALPGMFGGAR